MANVQTDAIDYYAIVQRLIGDEPPIVPNLPFVEQRSPGYPLLSLPAYYLLRGATFWGETETVSPRRAACSNGASSPPCCSPASGFSSPDCSSAVLGLRGLIAHLSHLFRRQP